MKTTKYFLLALLAFSYSCMNDDAPMDDPVLGTVDHSWAPLSRTVSQIQLTEEDVLEFNSNTIELDYYQNTAYNCGFSGNYTFLVVEPMNNPGAEAPLWVYLHGGGAGYFDKNQEYKIGVSPTNGTPRNPNNHNTEKTIENLSDGQLIFNTTTNNGQIESSTPHEKDHGRLSNIDRVYV